MPAMAFPKRESESLNIQLLVDSIPALIHTSLPDGYLDYFNKPWLEYLGAALEQVSGWNWTAFIHPEDLDGIVAKWRACLATGEIFEYETRVRRADGEYRWMFHRKVPLRDERANIVKWYGSSLDIEERKTAEELLSRNAQALQRSEFYLAEGQRLGHMGSWAFDPDGFDYWSPELFQMYGLDPAGKPPSVQEYLDFVHPQDRESMADLINGLVAEATPFDATKRIVRPDGEVRYIRCVGVPSVGSQSLKKFVGSAIDVTEHELLTQELRRREAYLAEAERLSHTGSFGWRPDTGELVWSDETYRIFEYDRSVKSTIDSVGQRVHPQDRTEFQKVVDGASRGARDFEHTYRLLLPNGRVKHVHAIAHALQDASGHREFVGAVTDITEQRQAEAVIRQQEAELRKVVDTIPALVWSTLPDGSNTYVNKRFVEYTGSSPEQTAGSGWQALIHPDDLDRHAGKWMEAIATGKPLENELRSRRSDGQYRWQLDRGVPLRDEDGNIVKWYGVTTDIEDRKRAEEKIRQSEQELRTITETIPAFIGTNLPDGSIDFVSQSFLDYLGLSREQWLDWGWMTATHPDDVAGAVEKFRAALTAGQPLDYEQRLRKSDGTYRWFWSRNVPLRDVAGNIVKWYGVLTDIEDRKTAEGKIREQEAEFRQIVELVPQHVAVFGPDGERLYANRVALDYVGLSLEEWRQTLGHSFGSSLFVHPDDQERVARDFDANSSSGSACELELRVRKGDGTYRWLLVRFNPLRDDQGQITRWYVASTDIEDRKQAEDRLRSENVALREEIDKTSMFEEIVGASPALRAVLSRISKVAPSDSTVLITGETGTGKELVARAIHRRSNRASRAFVSVNCAAIPRDLIASELFGHEKGAFTGATQQRVGRFELANGGTIFLDEVGDLPAETQIALLRVLQEHEFERVGGTRPIRSNLRVIAATNRDLQSAINAGSFRSDLFYRLNVFPIEIPALRERKEDIRLLVEYFIDRYARKAGKKITTVDKETLRLLESYYWPGNIRELQNVIERSVIVCETENFSVDESWLYQKAPESKAESQLYLSEKVTAQEREMIEAALRECQGRVFGPSGAAAKLGIARSTLESKIRSLKIDKNRFRAIPGT
jgi:PAS domain S-box-containing protein